MLNKGNINNVNLIIEDVMEKETEKLLKDTTVANFGKLNADSKKEDIALGTLNMVMETIGVMVSLAVQNLRFKDVILTGNLIGFPRAFEMIKRLEKIQNVNFIIPENHEYATALGAIVKLVNGEQ